jgi:hypothetical protein
VVEPQLAAQLPGVWPGRGVLLLCAVILVAGYAVAILRGPAPAGAVAVVLAPVEEAPGPAAP